VIVDVSLSIFVELQIYGTGRFPAGLITEIRKQKVEIYKRLKPSPENPDELWGSETLTVKGRRFDVLLVAYKHQVDLESDIYPMRVLVVDELKKAK
jgi:hypothetical protein